MMATTEDAKGEKLRRLLGYLAVDSRNSRLLIDASDAALEFGDFEQAKSLLERARALEPQNGALRFRFSHILLAGGEYEAARTLLLDLTATEGGAHPAFLYNLAYAQFGCDRMAEALATLKCIPPSGQPQLPQYALLLAKTLYFSGQVVQALEPLRAYLRRPPSEIQERGLCGLILFDNDNGSGNVELAHTLAKEALSTNLADPFAHLVLGSIELGRQQPEAARPYLLSLVEAQPTWGRAWSALGYMELLNLHLTKARVHFQKAVQYMPNHVGTWQGLAWTEILLKDFAAARAAVQSAMALDRTFSENHGTLAVIEIFDGRPELAEPEIKRGLRLDPKSPSSQYARSLLLTRMGDEEAGNKLIQRIVKDSGLQDGRLIAAMQARARQSNGGGTMFLPAPGNARKH
ncbi:tetratricopeptide repeat protein [Nevskia soli]|uniref:tetratricopeptide repeat protein n=1 Tax=Nevskia soli TaxID=418856 RepID=UPI0004A783D9|nr:tetratricopeptide repeat protein [Nevskia soli]